MEMPFKVKRIDHVAFCVPDGDAASARFAELFGTMVVHDEVVASQSVRAKFLRVGEGGEGGGPETELEIIVPKGNETIERFLQKRGPGLHHLAIEVEGIEAALTWFKEKGIPLVDETPRAGARGHKVAFLHPKATGGVLVELLEKS
jgi:methylmalonyl-CoA/ethylmalonyl-CoA epimerase